MVEHSRAGWDRELVSMFTAVNIGVQYVVQVRSQNWLPLLRVVPVVSSVSMTHRAVLRVMCVSAIEHAHSSLTYTCTTA